MLRNMVPAPPGFHPPVVAPWCLISIMFNVCYPTRSLKIALSPLVCRYSPLNRSPKVAAILGSNHFSRRAVRKLRLLTLASAVSSMFCKPDRYFSGAAAWTRRIPSIISRCCTIWSFSLCRTSPSNRFFTEWKNAWYRVTLVVRFAINCDSFDSCRR